MGDTKDQLKPANKTQTDLVEESEKGGMFSGLKGKKKKRETAEEQPKKFVDMITAAEDALAKMIATKSADIPKEKGQEAANKAKLNLLYQMQQNLDNIADLADLYHEV